MTLHVRVCLYSIYIYNIYIVSNNAEHVHHFGIILARKRICGPLILCQALAAALGDVHVVSGQDLTVEVAKAKKKQLGITKRSRGNRGLQRFLRYSLILILYLSLAR